MAARLDFLEGAVCRTNERVRVGECLQHCGSGTSTFLVVPYFERALYRLPDDELSGERIVALARECELRILGVPVGPRPLLSVPHLLNQEAAASYHGYLLATMAVHQTRAHCERHFGYLTDNPAIGPALAEHYWFRGNSISHDDTLRSPTGESFNAKYLADACNQSIEQVWQDAEARISAAATRSYRQVVGPGLDAHIRVVHGDVLIADNGESDEAMCDAFERWIDAHYPGNVKDATNR